MLTKIDLMDKGTDAVDVSLQLLILITFTYIARKLVNFYLVLIRSILLHHIL